MTQFPKDWLGQHCGHVAELARVVAGLAAAAGHSAETARAERVEADLQHLSQNLVAVGPIPAALDVLKQPHGEQRLHISASELFSGQQESREALRAVEARCGEALQAAETRLTEMIRGMESNCVEVVRDARATCDQALQNLEQLSAQVNDVRSFAAANEKSLVSLEAEVRTSCDQGVERQQHMETHVGHFAAWTTEFRASLECLDGKIALQREEAVDIQQKCLAGQQEVREAVASAQQTAHHSVAELQGSVEEWQRRVAEQLCGYAQRTTEQSVEHDGFKSALEDLRGRIDSCQKDIASAVKLPPSSQTSRDMLGPASVAHAQEMPSTWRTQLDESSRRVVRSACEDVRREVRQRCDEVQSLVQQQQLASSSDGDVICRRNLEKVEADLRGLRDTVVKRAEVVDLFRPHIEAVQRTSAETMSELQSSGARITDVEHRARHLETRVISMSAQVGKLGDAGSAPDQLCQRVEQQLEEARAKSETFRVETLREVQLVLGEIIQTKTALETRCSDVDASVRAL
eukprot:CAMPEP_0115616024 /NCGR_PEP_ID=MMETSP0272-20121206/22917_1 /TAXON_ID=71861 /ORGANISM="Scrippsiella trochoidea, Strain CCMP3099" /LENGTH=518 /DNA_ID=CAMNT_0003051939 /DNA_START=8 /DNA_END=1561 /DNA_ORIENTATION=-